MRRRARRVGVGCCVRCFVAMRRSRVGHGRVVVGMVGVVVVMVVGIFLVVVVGLAGAMHVPLSPIVQLIPQRFVGNAGGVLEDELPTMVSGVGQESEADQRQGKR